MFGRLIMKYFTKSMIRIMSLNSTSAEIISATTLLFFGIFFTQLSMPKNMLDFQLHIIWQFELLALGVAHFSSILILKNSTPLRIWLSFISGLFWLYLGLSAFACPGEEMLSIVSLVMSLSLWTGFVARSLKWRK